MTEAQYRPGRRPRIFVALGDSFTEGVGDEAAALPNGVRGWADRVAEQLELHDSSWRYANLAIRGKRLVHVLEEQLAVAIAMKPDLVSIYAGGNDLLGFRTDVPSLMAIYAEIVAELRSHGSQVLLFTGYPVPISPLLEPLKIRNAAYNQAVRRIASEQDALLVDYWCFEKFQDQRMWADDRLHMSTRGHIYMAKKVLEVLHAPHVIDPAPLGMPPHYSRSQRLRGSLDWTQRHFGPWLGRRIRRVSSGDGLSPRYPEPVSILQSQALKASAIHNQPEAAAARG
ncbi:SGNH/GDSL hydrolase family protein [Arthrobacter russicus]|uniref:Lysophospholipase L1-like esterase n=1 Tax=Arthrobacter russicus TaxID=172040 RepID=A0ABU1JC22_9MICC|nr:SGNH/GDSL hydrolase family protein [Arthrobacter russicus]MDN5667011.1 SGNH/GDSL hydrolase family protein [Renibacterium salmoninarum]MDR6269978.1 lysophospholipase L1-like esterase [Arthrobacter russicus]